MPAEKVNVGVANLAGPVCEGANDSKGEGRMMSAEELVAARLSDEQTQPRSSACRRAVNGA